VTLRAEVYSEMEPSSNDEEAEVQVACERSRIQAICSGEKESVSREDACGMSWGSATQPFLQPGPNLATAFLDADGIVLTDYLEHDCTITGTY